MVQTFQPKVLSGTTYDRLMRALRWLEPKMNGDGFDDINPPKLDYSTKTIRITGPAVELVGVESPSDETVELDEGEDLELDEGTPLGIDAEEVEVRYVYPAEFVWRDLDALGTPDEWQVYENTSAWAYALEEVPLNIGGYYHAESAGVAKAGDDEEERGLVQVQPGSGGGTEIIRVTGMPKSGPSSRRWYPGVISTFEEDSWVRADGQEVWLLQVKDAELATDGYGFYMAVRRSGEASVDSETRPVYETAFRHWVLNGACDPETGEWTPLKEGTFEGDYVPPPTTTTTTTTTA